MLCVCMCENTYDVMKFIGSLMKLNNDSYKFLNIVSNIIVDVSKSFK